MTVISAGNTTSTAFVATADTTGNLVFTTGGANTTALTLSNAQAATFVGSVNMPNTFGFKNRIINGGMTISQRGASATVTAGTSVPTASTGYPCVDRWFVYSTGGNPTAAQVVGTGNNQNNLQITGAASVTAVGVGQRIEDVNSYDLAGQTVTLSVNMSNSLLSNVTWTASYANTTNTFGTIGTPTKVQISTGTFTVNSTLTQYSTQISIPSNATTGIEILFTVGAQTSGTWVIGKAQLELGSQATSFDYVNISTELLKCQRYYETTAYPNVTQSLSTVVTTTTTTSGNVCGAHLMVAKRTTPTIVLYSRNGTAANVSYSATGADTPGSAAYIGGTSWAITSVPAGAASGAGIEFGWTAAAEL